MRAEVSALFEGGAGDECAGVEHMSAASERSGARAATGASSGAELAFDLPPEGIDLDKLERHLVEQAIERTGGNKTRAGALLGLTRDQVRYRMQKYGLDRDA